MFGWKCCGKAEIEDLDRKISEDSTYWRKLSTFSQRFRTKTARKAFDRSNLGNLVFPWLTDNYIAKSRLNKVKAKRDSMKSAKDIYKFLALFRTNTFSRMYIATMRFIDKQCNIKVYPFAGEKVCEKAENEAIVLDLLAESKFIVKPLEYFKTLGGHYLVTESFGNTTLHNLLKRSHFFTDDELKFYARELVEAIKYAHKKGIMLRSLTANNVGITGPGHIKLFDFEDAYIALWSDGERDPAPNVFEPVGLDAYKPPEMGNYLVYTTSTDWWSLGVLLYILAHGNLPFKGNTRRDQLQAVLNSEPSYSTVHSGDTLALIKQLLMKDPKERLGDRQIKKHPFFAGTDWGRVKSLGYDPPFPVPAHIVTDMPASLCNSIESIYRGVSVTDLLNEVRVQEGSRARAMSQNPLQFTDFELDPNWMTYIDTSTDANRCLVHIRSYLYPPQEQATLDVQDIEDCIVTCPTDPVETKSTTSLRLQPLIETGSNMDGEHDRKRRRTMTFSSLPSTSIHQASKETHVYDDEVTDLIKRIEHMSQISTKIREKNAANTVFIMLSAKSHFSGTELTSHSMKKRKSSKYKDKSDVSSLMEEPFLED